MVEESSTRGFECLINALGAKKVVVVQMILSNAMLCNETTIFEGYTRDLLRNSTERTMVSERREASNG